MGKKAGCFVYFFYFYFTFSISHKEILYSSNEIGKAQNNNYELNVNYIPLILFDVEAIGVS